MDYAILSSWKLDCVYYLCRGIEVVILVWLLLYTCRLEALVFVRDNYWAIWALQVSYSIEWWWFMHHLFFYIFSR